MTSRSPEGDQAPDETLIRLRPARPADPPAAQPIDQPPVDQPVEAGPAETPQTPPGPPSDAQPRTRRKRRRGLVLGLLLLLLLVLLGVFYVVGYAMAGDRVPRNATISGVPVGGLTPDAAAQRLQSELGPKAAAPIRLSVAGEDVQVDPATAGLAVDYQASVAKAGGGKSLDPRQIWRVLTGGSVTAPVITSDDAKLQQAVAALAKRTDRQPKDAALGFTGTQVKVTPAQTGITMDADGAVKIVRAAFLVATQPVNVSAATAQPEISTEAAEQLATSTARPAVASPITVTAGRAGRFQLSPAMIAGALSFPVENGALTTKLDGSKLHEAAEDVLDDIETDKPKNATVRIEDGKPKIVPAVNGTVVTPEKLAAAVQPALTATGAQRTVGVELSGQKAKFSTADAEKLGVTEVTGEFTTRFPYAEYRNVNIGRAAEKINNTLLKPGETFSLNGIVGERTRANGFVEGFIINNGRFKRELGGGVSQSATTTFNAMFFAGLKDIQHQPHTLYIDRYPYGREATVAWPNLDLKFQNDTKYGVVVQAFVQRAAPGGSGSITVRMWSTKTYDKITSSALERSNFTTGRDITDDGPDCEPTAPVQGFTVNYQRIFSNDGQVVKREPFRWTYGPTDRVICS